MNDSSATIASSFLERRRYRRYDLKYSVRLRFSATGSLPEIEGSSRNVSVLGLLLESPVRIPVGSRVHFTMNLRGEPILRPIQLVGDGEVRRVEPCPPDPGFVIAVACEDPITEMRDLAHVPDSRELQTS
ncbi:MAG: PilZ domain-containing protein [Acidobacteriia bacterium]|nr:PilZ domain-containing protein [Terriglobia bacterium]